MEQEAVKVRYEEKAEISPKKGTGRSKRSE
jgi:hypothetical protein